MQKIPLPLLLVMVTSAALAGCDNDRSTAVVAGSERDDARLSAAVPRIIFIGDSLTAGYGLEADEAFPALLGEMLESEGLAVHIVNAGVSGDTTAGGVRRLDWLLRQSPDVVVVGLGGNDGLRGMDLRATEENLRVIIRRCRAAGASVLLLGMLMPPNYGPDYTAQFRDLYPRLAREFEIPLVPFLLEGVGGNAAMNLSDGIHPTAEGHRLIARNVLPYLRDVVRPHVDQAITAPAAD